MTADDYEIVRHFAEDIEMILLNQIGVFFNGLIFPCYVGPDLQYRILFKVNIKDKLVERMECFMLSLNWEITIPPKTRKAENVKTEEEVQREIIKEKQRKVMCFYELLYLGFWKRLWRTTWFKRAKTTWSWPRLWRGQRLI